MFKGPNMYSYSGVWYLNLFILMILKIAQYPQKNKDRR